MNILLFCVHLAHLDGHHGGGHVQGRVQGRGWPLESRSVFCLCIVRDCQRLWASQCLFTCICVVGPW